MPAAGTRKIEISGEMVYLPEEAASIVDITRRALKLKKRMEADQAELLGLKNQVIEIANRHRSGRGTVRLESPEGQSATVTWKRETTVEPSAVEALREKLGKAFRDLFVTRTTYSLARTYKRWMSMPQGALEDLKAKIGAAISVVEHKPSVVFEDVLN